MEKKECDLTYSSPFSGGYFYAKVKSKQKRNSFQSEIKWNFKNLRELIAPLMEEENKEISIKSDLADESCETQAQISEKTSTSTNSDLKLDSAPAFEISNEPGTSSEVPPYYNTATEKLPGRRNYRRRSAGSDDSSNQGSNNGETEEPSTQQEATVEVAEEAQMIQSDSDDVSLDELQANASDVDGNQNAERQAACYSYCSILVIISSICLIFQYRL